MIVVAERAGVDAAFATGRALAMRHARAVGFSVASGSLCVSAEGMGRGARPVVNAARAFSVSTVAGAHSVPHVRRDPPIAASPVVIVSVVKRVAVRVVPGVVIDGVSMIPIESPMTPAPSKPCKEADSEAGSERKIGAVEPYSGIGVPTRPRHDRTSVNHPRIIRRDVNDIGGDRLNGNRRALRLHALLRCALQI